MDIREMVKKYEKERGIVYNNIDEKIRQIKENELTEEELAECLRTKQMYIISNSIIQIIQKKNCSHLVIEGLFDLRKCIGRRFVFADGVAIGHVAVAALGMLNSNDANDTFKQAYYDFSTEDKEKTLKAKEILYNITDNKNT